MREREECSSRQGISAIVTGGLLEGGFEFLREVGRGLRAELDADVVDAQRSLAEQFTGAVQPLLQNQLLRTAS